MKIVIDGRLISKSPTGISRYSLELIASYNNKFGIENVLVIINNADVTELFENSYFLTKCKPFNLFHCLYFSIIIYRKKFEFLHSPFYSSVWFKRKNLYSIITIHDLMCFIIPDFFAHTPIINMFGRLYYKILIYFSLSNSNQVISVSETTYNDTKRIFDRQSIVIPEGVNYFKSDSINDFEKIDKINCLYNLKPKEFFLYVGNFRRHKNIKMLLQAFKLYKGSNKLVLIGGNRLEIEENSNILWLKDISDSDLNYFYSNCAAFIFPSIYEGFGLPILEAISHNCVVFSSSGGGLKEFPFKSVHYFDPQNINELVELMNKSNEFNMDYSDIKFLDNYDWQKNFERMLQILFEV